ncbi:MAG: SHOCT domain-containing protein [Vicinamibacterales bacterium]
MWPYMGPMGGWMVLWWAVGLVVLVLVVRMATGTTGGFSTRGDDTPEQILKRRYAKGELDRDEYLRRLDDLHR